MNPDVDSGAEDIWNGGGAYPFPAAAAATTIVSNSAADDGAPVGTGARTVQVIGLDANLRLVSETATMDGTTPVALSNALFRLLRARVVTAGSNGTNVGVINVKHSSTNLCAMPTTPGLGRTHIGVFTVPATDYGGGAFAGAYIVDWGATIADASANTVARVRLDIRPSGGAWETIDMCSVVSGGFFHNGFGGAVALAAGTDIRLHCIDVTSANSTVTGHVDVVLLK